MSTYQGQDKLPKLPIPKLEDTCARYVKALTPLLSEQQLATTRAAVDAFVATDGPKLQQELCAYAEDKASYIEDFWYDAYLAGSSSVVLNINPYFVLEDDPVPQHNDQGRRAAALTISALQFLCKLRAETLAPDDWRGAPLCMNQYRRLFGCTRMPKDGCDQIQSHPDSKHLVVMAKGRIYYFDVLWGDGSLCVSEERLCANLQLILDDARAATSGGGPAGLSQQLAESVGVLTSELRPTWHALRAQLSRDADNAASLEIVDSALFVLCLDDDAPSTPEDVAKTMLHGTYAMRDGVQVGSICNRWYDKMQIIVCANGAAGVNFEHTSVDGHTVLRFVSDVFAATIMRFAAKISSAKMPGADGGGAPTVKLSRGNSARDVQSGVIELDANPTPHHVGWRLSPQLEQAVRFAEVRLSDLVHQNETCTLEFDAFGKLGIVTHKLSPDAFVQLAMMAAYYALFGRVVNVYEPVQTKGFLHGRRRLAREARQARGGGPRRRPPPLRAACHPQALRRRRRAAAGALCRRGLGRAQPHDHLDLQLRQPRAPPLRLRAGGRRRLRRRLHHQGRHDLVLRLLQAPPDRAVPARARHHPRGHPRQPRARAGAAGVQAGLRRLLRPRRRRGEPDVQGGGQGAERAAAAPPRARAG